MALLDAYATRDEYRAAFGDKATGADDTLDADLLGVSRNVDWRLRVQDGGLNEHTGTYDFDAHGGTLLRLRDQEGRRYLLQSVPADAIGVDLDLDGTFDYYQLDFDDAWVRGYPSNAAAQSRPYTAIELLPHITSAEPVEWPTGPGLVRISGATWGLASGSALMQLVKSLVLHRTKEIRDALKAGPTQELPAFEGTVPLGRQTAFMFKEIERHLGRHVPAVA